MASDVAQRLPGVRGPFPSGGTALWFSMRILAPCVPVVRAVGDRGVCERALAARPRGGHLGRRDTTRRGGRKGDNVLYYAMVFLIVAIVAGLLGFGAIAFAAAGIAKILFFLFLIAFLVSLVAHIGRRAL